jgi:cytochrome c oxidase subunit 4
MSEHHITPLKTYLVIAGALFCLTAITVWVSYFDFGSLNIIIAMGVATFKATLVALFFFDNY